MQNLCVVSLQGLLPSFQKRASINEFGRQEGHATTQQQGTKSRRHGGAGCQPRDHHFEPIEPEDEDKEDPEWEIGD